MSLFIHIICIAMVSFWIVRGIYVIVKTYLRARSNGIIKACIHPRVILITLIGAALMSVGIFTAFGKAAEANKNKAEWEQFRNTEYSEEFIEYYNENIADRTGVEIKDFGKFVLRQVGRYENRANLYMYTGAVSVVMTLLLLLYSLEKVFYITENGCVVSMLKEPEKLTAECKGGKINFYLESARERDKPLISFKAAAENLAVLGGFIEREEKSEGSSPYNDIL